MQKFDHGMRIVFENRIMSNVLFELMNGTKIWYTDMNSIQRGHADKLLAAQHSLHPTVATVAAQKVALDARNSGSRKPLGLSFWVVRRILRAVL